MTKEEYSDYLQTSKWKERRLYRLNVDGFRCQLCGSEGSSFNPLTVHHLDYYSVGNEDERALMNSTVTLCSICHASVHRMMNRQTWDKDSRIVHGWADVLPISLHVFEEGTERQAIYYENKK